MTIPRELVASVEAFMHAAGDLKSVPSVRVTALYIGLQCEELAEKLAAIGEGDFAARLQSIGMSFKNGSSDVKVAFAMFDPKRATEMLDADFDLAWVSIASAFAMGADVLGACTEGAASNHSKIRPDGTVGRDGNGKIVKPDYFVKPDFRPFLHPTLRGAMPGGAL